MDEAEALKILKASLEGFTLEELRANDIRKQKEKDFFEGLGYPEGKFIIKVKL